MCPMLKQNEGKTDRMIRLVLGVVLLGVGYFVFSGTIQTILVVLGLVSLITGAIGFCGLYKVLGISTIEKK